MSSSRQPIGLVGEPVIGILAGMGPYSTGPFVNLILDECKRQYGAVDDDDFPRMMVLSQPAPFLVNDNVDDAALQLAVRSGLEQLERAGATLLAIACNTAHAYFPSLANNVSTPLLNIVESTTRALDSLPKTVALVGSSLTVKSKIYQDGLAQHGIETLNMDWQADVNSLIQCCGDKSRSMEAEKLWSKLAQKASRAGADAVIVACLDLSAILDTAAFTLPVIDASEHLARDIVRTWLSQKLLNEHNGHVATSAADRLRNNYALSFDHGKLDYERIFHWLDDTHWARGIGRETVKTSIKHSLAVGVYARELGQIGFARAVCDLGTFAFICDVIVDEKYRGQGVGKWMVEALVNHPSVSCSRRILLTSRDAQHLYRRHGFGALKTPDIFMEIYQPFK